MGPRWATGWARQSVAVSVPEWARQSEPLAGCRGRGGRGWATGRGRAGMSDGDVAGVGGGVGAGVGVGVGVGVAVAAMMVLAVRWRCGGRGGSRGDGRGGCGGGAA